MTGYELFPYFYIGTPLVIGALALVVLVVFERSARRHFAEEDQKRREGSMVPHERPRHGA
jgi:hypothetical protein